jgi:hypothetical protein
MNSRKPSLNPSLFKGLTASEEVGRQGVEPDAADAERSTRGARPRQPPPVIESASKAAAAVGGRRYQRLHLYATEDMLRRMRQIQAEALAANLPMAQRGPSVIMAATLDCFEELAPTNRLEAIKNRLGAR